MDSSLFNRIAKICLDHYKNLPKTGKPQANNEWTHLAAIVKTEESVKSETLIEVVSLATGSKCIGESKMSENGDVVNDSHAEVLSRRGFLRYIYCRLSNLFTSDETNIFEYNSEDNICSLKTGVKFHLFISHTPCGDASIISKHDNTLKRKAEEDQDVGCKKISIIDATLKYLNDDTLGLPSNKTIDDTFRTGAKCVPNTKQDLHLPGSDYHVIGVLRTKPGRGDRTRSLSCSDKIAKWNIVGLQGALLSHFITPIYLTSIIIGKCPYDKDAMQRAVFERIILEEELPKAFRHHCPHLLNSSLAFVHGRERVSCCSGKIIASSSAVIWSNVPFNSLETIVNGRRQGVTKKAKNSLHSRSNVSKSCLFESFRKVLKEASTKNWTMAINCRSTSNSYNDFKLAAVNYQKAKLILYKTLDGWPTKPQQLQMFGCNS